MNQHTDTNTKGLAKWLVLFVLCAAQVGTSGDNSIIGIAAAELVNTFGASMSDVQMANATYSLMTGAFMIAGGLMGMVFGWVRCFRLGLILLITAEIVGAFAPTIEVFIWGARVLAGIGASLSIPAVLGIIAGTYKGKDQAIAFGGVAAASGIASAVMPVLAALLIDNFGLSAAMLAIAVYFVGVLAASFKLKELAKPERTPRIDGIGILLCAIGLVLFIVGALKVPELGVWQPITDANILGISPAPLMIILGIVVLCGFYVWEGKVEDTYGNCLLPRAIITNKQVIAGLMIGGAFWIGFASPAVIIIPHMQIAGSASALSASVIGIALAVGTVITSIIVPAKFSSLKVRTASYLGLGLASVAALLFALSFSTTGINMAIAALAATVLGVGCGLMATQCSIIVTDALDEANAQQSGGIQAAARNVGYAIGIAFMGVVMLLTMSSSFKSSVENSATISATTKQEIAQLPSIGFLGDTAFLASMSETSVLKQDIEELTKVNQETRLTASQSGMYSVAFSFILLAWFIRYLPHRSLMVAKSEPRKEDELEQAKA
ncbi:MFS transporter [Vibrio lamellibrachiae]|uniref:MFS transporter n=1 Tax=Vibrio lamellibrachiae TaxID=2910253 RepID=UPI003D0D033D